MKYFLKSCVKITKDIETKKQNYGKIYAKYIKKERKVFSFTYSSSNCFFCLLFILFF